MTPDRFAALAEAYGGDVARWPASEREGAALVMAADPVGAETVLASARTLDSRLDAWAPPRASPQLVDAIILHAPKLRVRPSWRAWLAPVGLGAGLAAACVAGVLVGSRLAVVPATGAPDAAAVAAAADEAEFENYLDEEVA